MNNEPPDRDVDQTLEDWAASRIAPAARVERRIREMLAPSLTRVTPLPSQMRLTMTFLGVFAAGSAVCIALLGKAGFHLMTAAQMVWIIVALMCGAVLFSAELAGRMVPGSRRRFPLSFVFAFSCSAVIGIMALLFPWKASPTFVFDGWPCAALELAIAVAAVLIFLLLARRGFPFVSAGLGASLAGLAVFLALAAVQFQCMFQRAPHLLVWHGAVACMLIAAGASIGYCLRAR